MRKSKMPFELYGPTRLVHDLQAGGHKLEKEGGWHYLYRWNAEKGRWEQMCSFIPATIKTLKRKGLLTEDLKLTEKGRAFRGRLRND